MNLSNKTINLLTELTFGFVSQQRATVNRLDRMEFHVITTVNVHVTPTLTTNNAVYAKKDSIISPRVKNVIVIQLV